MSSLIIVYIFLQKRSGRLVLTSGAKPDLISGLLQLWKIRLTQSLHLSSPRWRFALKHNKPFLLHDSFDVLIDSFIDTQVGVADYFLSEALAGHLRQNLADLYASEQLLQAGTGNEAAASMDSAVRGDRIYWLDRAHDDPFENAFLNLIDELILYLNSTCYTGITGYEFHYTLYEKGRFYKKHIDQFRTDQSRKYSMIIYLNADWRDGDGGELCIHHKDSLQYISPANRRGVFFLSHELEHEVLVTNEPRMSITGWLKVVS